jgi:small subunit ribosomal protein S9
MAEDERRDPEQQPTEPGAAPETPADEPAAAEPAGAAAEQGTGVPEAEAGGEEAGEQQPSEQEAEPGAEPVGETLDEEAAADLEPTAEEVAAERADETGDALEEAAERERRPRGKVTERGERDVKTDVKDEVIPGEHLEPDLVLEPEAPTGEDEFAYAERAAGEEATAEVEAAAAPEPVAEAPAAEEQPAVRRAVDLAADARYVATGKRKTSVARVILRPGSGAYTINGRPLESYFPRPTLQKAARQPLETAGYQARMDVVARIHGGGVSAQAGALRHGVARALVEADPALRVELKRRGYLTRDARVKERKKAGLKKARKRPQFSKR